MNLWKVVLPTRTGHHSARNWNKSPPPPPALAITTMHTQQISGRLVALRQAEALLFPPTPTTAPSMVSFRSRAQPPWGWRRRLVVASEEVERLAEVIMPPQRDVGRLCHTTAGSEARTPVPVLSRCGHAPMSDMNRLLTGASNRQPRNAGLTPSVSDT